MKPPFRIKIKGGNLCLNQVFYKQQLYFPFPGLVTQGCQKKLDLKSEQFSIFFVPHKMKKIKENINLWRKKNLAGMFSQLNATWIGTIELC